MCLDLFYTTQPPPNLPLIWGRNSFAIIPPLSKGRCPKGGGVAL